MQDDSNYFPVEKILDKRFNHSLQTTEYFIKWKGYSETQSTWEPLSHLGQVLNMVRDFETKQRSRRRKCSVKNLHRESESTWRQVRSKSPPTSPLLRSKSRSPVSRTSPPRKAPPQKAGIAHIREDNSRTFFPNMVLRPANLQVDRPVRIIGCGWYGNSAYYSVLFRMRADGTIPLIGVYSHEQLKQTRSDLLSEFLLSQPVTPSSNFLRN